MQTYSHYLITAVLKDQIEQKKAVSPSKALLIGSFLPDVPLFILTIGYFISRLANPATADGFLFDQTYDALYFNNPWWIFGHNLFHAPLPILFYAAIGYALLRQTARPGWQKWGWPLIWLAVGCGLHSVIDIFTHVTDGPVLFFPFNWTYRYPAPVSYWDPQYGGRTFAIVEHLLDLVLIIYVVRRWRIKRKQTKGVNL